MDKTLSGATTPDKNRPGNITNEGVPHILQSSSITGISPSECSVSYPGHSLEGCLIPLQRCSQCILQLQLTGQSNDCYKKKIFCLRNCIEKLYLSYFTCKNKSYIYMCVCVCVFVYTYIHIYIYICREYKSPFSST